MQIDLFLGDDMPFAYRLQMGDKAQQEKLVGKLRAFARTAGKVCADCNEKVCPLHTH